MEITNYNPQFTFQQIPSHLPTTEMVPADPYSQEQVAFSWQVAEALAALQLQQQQQQFLSLNTAMLNPAMCIQQPQPLTYPFNPTIIQQQLPSNYFPLNPAPALFFQQQQLPSNNPMFFQQQQFPSNNVPFTPAMFGQFPAPLNQQDVVLPTEIKTPLNEQDFMLPTEMKKRHSNSVSRSRSMISKYGEVGSQGEEERSRSRNRYPLAPLEEDEKDVTLEDEEEDVMSPSELAEHLAPSLHKQSCKKSIAMFLEAHLRKNKNADVGLPNLESMASRNKFVVKLGTAYLVEFYSEEYRHKPIELTGRKLKAGEQKPKLPTITTLLEKRLTDYLKNNPLPDLTGPSAGEEFLDYLFDTPESPKNINKRDVDRYTALIHYANHHRYADNTLDDTKFKEFKSGAKIQVSKYGQCAKFLPLEAEVDARVGRSNWWVCLIDTKKAGFYAKFLFRNEEDYEILKEICEKYEFKLHFDKKKPAKNANSESRC